MPALHFELVCPAIYDALSFLASSMFSNLNPNLSIGSIGRRFLRLIREIGLFQTLGVAVSFVEDRFLRIYDRWYGVKTSGFIRLDQTSFASKRSVDSTALYGPVNAWAFRRMLRKLNLSRTLSFVDIGCGLARPCFLAAEYGFQRVTGVELASELCAMARENIRTCRLAPECRERITIVEMDALRYCETTEDDVFFFFRPFSLELMRESLRLLTVRAAQLGKPMTVIYTERIAPGNSHMEAFADSAVFRPLDQLTALGQTMVAFEFGPQHRAQGHQQ